MTIELLSKEWADFTEALRKQGYALLQAANPKLVVTDKRAADPNIIAALCCRTLTHLDAVRILLRAGLVVEARTIVRNCFENAFWLAAIAEPTARRSAAADGRRGAVYAPSDRTVCDAVARRPRRRGELSLAGGHACVQRQEGGERPDAKGPI